MTEEMMPATPENNSLELLSNRPAVPGMEKFDASDLVIPIVKLIQGSSDVKDGRPGQFINTTTNKVMDSPDLIFITYAKEMKVWQDKNGNDLEPKPQYKFLVLDAKTKWPMFLYVSGTSLWPAKTYLNAYWMQGVPLWYSVTGIIAKQKENRSGLGKYYVMEFEALRDTTNEERMYAQAFYAKYGQKMIESGFEQDVAAANGSGDEVEIADVPL